MIYTLVILAFAILLVLNVFAFRGMPLVTRMMYSIGALFLFVLVILLALVFL